MLSSSTRRRGASCTCRCPLSCLLLLLFSTTTTTTTVVVAQQAGGGLQSGGDGTLPSFLPAKGAFVDYANNVLTLGGSSAASSDCYLTRIDLATLTPVVIDNNATTTSTFTVTIPNAGTCTAMTRGATTGQTILTGHVGVANQTAAAFQVSVRDDVVAPVTVFYDNTAAVYPVAITAIQTEDPAAAPDEEHRIFSLAMQTATTTATPAVPRHDDSITDYRLAVRRVTTRSNSTAAAAVNTGYYNYRQVYRFAYGATVNGSPVPIYASDALLLSNPQQSLLVTGSTRGGGITDAGSTFGAFTGGNDVDGFVVKFDSSIATTTAVPPSSTTTTARLASANQRDDFVHGACVDSKNGEQYVFVVGSTAGEGVAEAAVATAGSVSGSGMISVGTADSNNNSSTTTSSSTTSTVNNNNAVGSSSSSSMEAFVAKIDVATMEVVWVRQWGGSSSSTGEAAVVVEGLACAVASDGIVYVGGTVSAGATVAAETDAAAAALGGRDVYVAQISAGDGTLAAVAQMGSDQDDGLVGVAVDAEGSAVVTAYTYGSWYRTRSASETSAAADWVVTKVPRAGAVDDDNDAGGGVTEGEPQPPTAAPAAVVEDDTSTAMPTVAPSNAPSKSPSSSSSSPNDNSTTATDSGTAATGEDDDEETTTSTDPPSSEETTTSTDPPSSAPTTNTTSAPSSLRAGSSRPTPAPAATANGTDDPATTEATDSRLNSAAAAGSLSAPSSRWLLLVVWTTVTAAVLAAASF